VGRHLSEIGDVWLCGNAGIYYDLAGRIFLHPWQRSFEVGLEEKIPDSIILTSLDKMVNWARTRSMWPLGFGLACCAIEMISTFASHYDLARFGMEVMRPSPRQADLMIVAGRVSVKMAPVVKRLYDQMPNPKWVISMGACASCGGVFNNYAIVQGVDKIIPVDIYVPGCPPRPEQLMEGILKLFEKVKKESLKDNPDNRRIAGV
jgi:NADH-quinone oxidoreductase subunit B